MEMERTRRSDRIALRFRITVSGTDAMGHGFLEETETVVVSRHGAKIALRRKLVPELELSVRCADTGEEADVRVVGQIGEGPEGVYYGIEILDPQRDLWGIEFPHLAESEKAVVRTLLECVHCRTREIAYLDELEAEVFEANKILSRACKRCRDMTLWKLSEGEVAEAQLPLSGDRPVATAAAPARPARTQNERKNVRVELQTKACIRTPIHGEDVVLTGNVSRDGFSFQSSVRYAVDSVVEASVPYSPGAANIFSPARIKHAEETSGQDTITYGAQYIRVHKGWPGE
jgi:hypothetical protein